MYPFQGVQFEGQKLHEADFITVVVVDTVRPKARLYASSRLFVDGFIYRAGKCRPILLILFKQRKSTYIYLGVKRPFHGEETQEIA